MKLLLKALLLTLAVSMTTATASPQDALWQALRSGGHVALMRHALAPGNGDPDRFDINDCSTQRNLSDTGRDQARQVGEWFRQNGIERLPVHSSQWCRCIETAELLALGDVAEQASLNSFYEDRAAGPRQTADTLRWLQAQMSGPSLMLVTHQVNVTALSGVYPQSGEVVVARIEADGLRVLGTIAPP